MTRSGITVKVIRPKNLDLVEDKVLGIPLDKDKQMDLMGLNGDFMKIIHGIL
jgi:hypothetical protein